MQKTIPVQRGSTSLLWLGPNKEYAARQARVKAIEHALVHPDIDLRPEAQQQCTFASVRGPRLADIGASAR